MSRVAPLRKTFVQRYSLHVFSNDDTRISPPRRCPPIPSFTLFISSVVGRERLLGVGCGRSPRCSTPCCRSFPIFFRGPLIIQLERYPTPMHLHLIKSNRDRRDMACSLAPASFRPLLGRSIVYCMLSAAALILEFLSAVVDKECGEFLDVRYFSVAAISCKCRAELQQEKRERHTYNSTGCVVTWRVQTRRDSSEETVSPPPTPHASIDSLTAHKTTSMQC